MVNDMKKQKHTEMKPRITLVINRLMGGGAERVTCALANYLYANNYSVDIIVMSDAKGSFMLEDGVRTVVILRGAKKMNKLNKFHKKFIGLKKYITSQKDISCYIVMMPLNAFMIAKLNKYMMGKLIVSERNNPTSYMIREKLMMKYAARRCGGLVVQTEEISQWYKNVKNRTVIPNAINDGVIVKRERIENKFVAVGRLEKQKNYPMMIDAFAEFSKQHPEYTLEIYGEGRERKRITKLISKYKLNQKIKLMGYVDNISNCVSTAAGFIMSSNYEGIPNALIEAMCIGLPCIATDCDGGGARGLIENGENGILIKKNDVDEMVLAMNKIIEDHDFSKKISNEAKKIKYKLNSEKIYSEWLQFINNTLRGKNA